MSLDGYADEGDDVGELCWRGDLVGFLAFWSRCANFTPAVWLEHIIRTDSWCGPCKTDLPPIYI